MMLALVAPKSLQDLTSTSQDRTYSEFPIWTSDSRIVRFSCPRHMPPMLNGPRFAMPLQAACSRTQGREEARERRCRTWAAEVDAYLVTARR